MTTQQERICSEEKQFIKLTHVAVYLLRDLDRDE